MKLKKSFYKDYMSSSDYFENPEESLKNEIEAVENTKKYFTWVQEFSKKIIIVIFGIYIVTAIFMLAMVYLSYKIGSIAGIDTLITETNETFRQIVGGYLIKSAVENAVKIGGNYFVGVSDAKLRALKERLKQENIIKSYGKDLNEMKTGFDDSLIDAVTEDQTNDDSSEDTTSVDENTNNESEETDTSAENQEDDPEA